MMRYVVQTDRAIWQDDSGVAYYVSDTQGRQVWIGYDSEFGVAELIEAEAQIIACALNAIADGKYIAASPGYTLVASNVPNGFEPGDFVEYAGPTDGVAP